MSSLPSKPFSDSKLKDNLQSSTSASLVIQLATQVILQQADIKLDVLPNLPEHQDTARKHATSWNDSILPTMVKTIADVIDYGHTYESFNKVLVGFAKNIDNPESKKKLVEGLKILHDKVNKKRDGAQAVVDQLKVFQKGLAEDHKNFEADYQIAQDKIAGLDSDGEIANLQKLISGLKTAMNNDIAMMSVGAVAIVGGIAMMVLGAVLEIPSAGFSTALIGGGFLLTAGGTITETLGSLDYSDKMKQMKQLTEQLTDDKNEMLALNHAHSTLSDFVDAIDKAISAAGILVGTWTSLGSNLKEVIDAVDDVDTSIGSQFIVAELEAAYEDWLDARKLAENLQPNGQVSATMYDDLQKIFDEAKPQG